MQYSLVLRVNPKGQSKLFDVLSPEAGKKDRSEIQITQQSQRVIINISAADPTALKSSVNSVIKALTIFEKTHKLIENG